MKKMAIIAAAVLMAANLKAGEMETSRTGAADFGIDPAAGLAAAAEPAPVPAPFPAAGRTCRPFLISLSVGGVDENVVIERACSARNEAFWVFTVERRGVPDISARVSSLDRPETRRLVEERIKAMALSGLEQEDADVIVIKTGPVLELAAKDPAGRGALLAEAKRILYAHLTRPLSAK